MADKLYYISGVSSVIGVEGYYVTYRLAAPKTLIIWSN